MSEAVAGIRLWGLLGSGSLEANSEEEECAPGDRWENGELEEERRSSKEAGRTPLIDRDVMIVAVGFAGCGCFAWSDSVKS